MKAISFYHAESGLLHDKQLVVSDESTIALNCPEGHLPIQGHHDCLCKRVDLETKAVIDYQPPSPSADHEWDQVSKRWRLTADALAAANQRTTARARISHLEANVQPRAQRELLLAIAKQIGTDPGRLQQVEDTIAKARQDL